MDRPKKPSGQVEAQNVSRFFGEVRAADNLTFSIDKGEFFSLIGPSGCGKTTILRLIAGLDRPDGGAITIGGKMVAGDHFWIPPESRGVGIVFQDYALFPHMTVYQNIAFGLKDLAREETRVRIEEILSVTGLKGLEKRYPHELSGGQCQRVALARSLAPTPGVILLDEPFSNLDASLRDELRDETKRILKETGATSILVTHDQEEAFCLSDRIGVLNNGRLEQIGTPTEIYHRPDTRFVADFVGKADFLAGVVEGETVVTSVGVFPLERKQLLSMKNVDLMFRPDYVDFTVDSSGNAVIAEARFLGAYILYKLQLSGGQAIHSLKASTEAISSGVIVQTRINAVHTVAFPSRQPLC